MTVPQVHLRDVRDSDVPVFYEQQLDPAATDMAAFPSRDWPTFSAHWDRIRRGGSSVLQSIEVNGEVAGNITSWVQDGQWLVGYWLGQAYWGRGVATLALSAFLAAMTQRPMFAHVAEHNVGSRRVLEKNGFKVVGQHFMEADGFLPATVEVELRLD